MQENGKIGLQKKRGKRRYGRKIDGRENRRKRKARKDGRKETHNTVEG